MWRKKEWKLILYLPGHLKDAITRLNELQGELYHLTDDPAEWTNLFEQESYAKIREQMTAESSHAFGMHMDARAVFL